MLDQVSTVLVADEANDLLERGAAPLDHRGA